jgi:hypothetical protein
MKVITPNQFDGPLTHLIARQHEIERELDRVKLNIEYFLVAVQIITRQAAGEAAPKDVPAAVWKWVKVIRQRSGAQEQDQQVQRAD